MAKEIWFNGDKGFSKNCLFSFFETIRGTGKTYWAKKKMVDYFLETGQRAFYVRRYDSELKPQKNFWGQITSEYPNLIFGQNGRTLLIGRPEEQEEGKKPKLHDAGALIPLSKALTLKSVDYASVGLIVFDEFQIPKGNYHYLSGEVGAFLDLYETVNRLRGFDYKTGVSLPNNEVRVIFLANRISDYNPYYDYFHINFKGQDTYRRGEIYAQRPEMKLFQEAKQQTRFAKLIEGTEYGNYNLHGEQQDAYDNKQIEQRPKDSHFWHSVVVSNVTYGMWADRDGKVYISDKYDPTIPINFALARGDAGDGLYYATKQDGFGKRLAYKYKLGMVFYENARIKENVQPAIARYCTQ